MADMFKNGVLHFDYKAEELAPAEAAARVQLEKDLAALVALPKEQRTFENTIMAYERAFGQMHRTCDENLVACCKRFWQSCLKFAAKSTIMDTSTAPAGIQGRLLRRRNPHGTSQPAAKPGRQRPQIYHLRRDHAAADPAELREDPHGLQL